MKWRDDGGRGDFDHLRSGDTVVVWKLDQLSRSLKDLLILMDKIDKAAARFRSLTEAIDTTTAAGRMMNMVGAFVEFERAMIRERTMQDYLLPVLKEGLAEDEKS